MSSSLLVVHERIAFWARQLRPRLVDRGVRLVQTRSAVDLRRTLGGHGSLFPVVLIDLGRCPRTGLEDLDEATRAAPDALVLVLDPGQLEGVPLLARELGATLVISGPVPPPEVAALGLRWLSLAARRSEAAGWSAPEPEEVEPEPWNWLAPMLEPHP